MSERFPSGPWVGYYTYSGSANRHRTDLRLEFSEGRMTGAGDDDVGFFTIHGSYDEDQMECRWLKTYPGSHDVDYRGFRDARGIWGTWRIGALSTGGFHIWPKGAGASEELRAEEGEDLPAEAFEHRPKSLTRRPRE